MKYVNMYKNAPEVQALRKQIEKKVGRSINSPSEFDNLSRLVELETGEHLSSTTFKRLWNYIDGADSTRESTLRILSNFLGYETFADFCNKIMEFEEFQSNAAENRHIISETLQMDDRLMVSWAPNRKCIFRYLGEGRFEVEQSANSKLCVGDRFNCAVFAQGIPLYLYNLVHDNQDSISYVAGRKNGITVQKLD